MGYLKWGLRLLVALILLAMFLYWVPDRDVVRIVNTEVRRIDVDKMGLFWASTDKGSAPVNSATRDVRFIETITPDGAPMVYRNEDTGWGWPPYFKFDTSNLQTRGADLASTADDPRWVVLTHYGWRNTWLSIYPNAVGLRPVATADPGLFPWPKLLVLALLALALFWLWRLWRRFREDMIDPLLGGAGETREHLRNRAKRSRGWLNRAIRGRRGEGD